MSKSKYKFLILGALILCIGNLICYYVNGRLLKPFTNTACLILMVAALYKTQNEK